MSFPAEGAESMFKNHIDDVRNYLEARHRNSYAVYNLSQRSYRVAKFENRVSISLHLSTEKTSLTHCSRETPKRVFDKQCGPRSDATECAI